MSQGVWKLLQHFGWKQASLLFEESEAGRLFLQRRIEESGMKNFDL